MSPAGVITTYAGNGTLGFSGDGGPATNAQFLFGLGQFILGIATDGKGNLYIADGGNNRVRMVDTAGSVRTVAGNGVPLSGGDNGLATSASLAGPAAVAVDANDNLYILEGTGNRVRMVDGAGVIHTVAGNGGFGSSGDGGAATSATFNGPTSIAIDGLGNLYVVDRGNSRVRKVTPAGAISALAGERNSGILGRRRAWRERAIVQPRGRRGGCSR